MCFRKKNNNDNNEKKRILNKNNYHIFQKYNSTETDDNIIEFCGNDLNKLVLEIEKYINNLFDKSKFKIMGSIIINNISYYTLIDNNTKDKIKVRYTLIDHDLIKILVINEVIYCL